jgi:hypothetical protein
VKLYIHPPLRLHGIVLKYEAQTEFYITRHTYQLHNEELHDLYSSPNIIRMIKSRRIWAGHVAEWEEKRIYDIGDKARRKEPTRKTKT